METKSKIINLSSEYESFCRFNEKVNGSFSYEIMWTRVPLCHDILDEIVSEEETKAEGFVVKVRDMTLMINNLSQHLSNNCLIVIRGVANG